MTCQPLFPIEVQFHVSNVKQTLDVSHLKILQELFKVSRTTEEEEEKEEEGAASGSGSGGGDDLHWKKNFEIRTLTRKIKPWTGVSLKDITDRPSGKPGVYDFYIAPSVDDAATKAFIKSERQGFIQVQDWNEANVIKAAADTLNTIFGPQERVLKKIGSGSSEKKLKDELKAVKYAPGYLLTFSLFSGDASNGIRGWRIQEGISAYLTPFLKSMSVISKFNIESQVQHYASLTFEPQVDPVNGEHYLTPDSLSNFINAAEWSLTSTVSSFPSLNFMVYVPRPVDSPLVIKQGPDAEHTTATSTTTNSFLIPRWGGITILNQNSTTGEDADLISVKELEPIMRVFLSQLRELLGVPDLSMTIQKSSTTASRRIPIQFQKRGYAAAVPTAWELDYLIRIRWVENMVDSVSTLTSLARLVADTPNMVVLDHIQKDVVEALKDIGESCALMGGGSEQEYIAALARSRDGLVKAETAFFDPTMVSMLYFPDEHKYAIYMPLFVPISVPLVMVVLRELKKVKEEKAKKKKDMVGQEQGQGHEQVDDDGKGIELKEKSD
ncbi:hypothetical protein BG004_006818 [Podila humilis]|nr:hypothetical protein BG004_006818 [Podila humilis]